MPRTLGLTLGLTLVLGSLTLAGCSGAANQPAGAPGLKATADTGVIRGVVVDQGVRPLAGANVTLRAEPPRMATTGADGSFGFAGVAPGIVLLEARKPGYSPATTSVEVVAGVDEPRTTSMQLVFNAGLLPFVDSFVFEGFVECSFHMVGGYFAACAAGPIANNLVCADTGICPGSVTNDHVYTIQNLTGPPDFLQSELIWESTQSLGDSLQLYVNYGTLDEFNQGGYNNTFNITTGPSPIYATVNATEARAAKLGTVNQFVPEILAGPYEPITQCVPPGSTTCADFGAAFEQRFRLFTHAFYNFLPPVGWRFSTAGTPPPPPT